MQTLRLILLINAILATAQAWKPIAPTYTKSSAALAGAGAGAGASESDTAAAAAEYKTTSFSLKQSHPGSDLGHKTPTSYSTFEGNADAATVDVDAVDAVDAADALYLSRASVAQPITFEQLDDQYESYSLEDDYKSDLLKSHRSPSTHYGTDSTCSVKKFAFNHDGIVSYDNELPELQQFTMCFWMRFTNHSGDHVLLTYSVAKEPREIQIWVSNAKNSSFLSMAIKGQQMYRLNYPLRMRQWHHMCSSWNGKTGEWQVWLKAERIGRGFHNSLVGHKVPAKGKLSSGGPSITGEVSQGLHFEITLVQVYRIALSAGKAHRDHKHHHVHHFDHDGQELQVATTRATPMINRPQSQHSLLASGQIPTRVRINLAQPSGQKPDDLLLLPQQQQQQQQAAITINTNFVNGQINVGSRLVAQQLLTLPSATSFLRKPIVAAAPPPAPAPAPPQAILPQFDMLSNSANVQFVDETETRIKFKRNALTQNAKATATAAAATTTTRTTAKPKEATTTTSRTNRGRKAKQQSITTTTTTATTKQLKKRGLLLLDDGSVIDDGNVDSNEFKYDGLAEFGGQQFKSELSTKMLQLEEAVTTHDREPAEEEVKAVMALCGTCDIEPFQGAIVFAWKDVHDQMDNTLKGLSVGGCGHF